ncbi:Kinesin-1 heavy chain [Thelohanellus kitauei]|uniref:Kinesin-1 heavy chain n=1 Tax=Thelohanellus kitauei TaxID=669202 RepID=A0A0C2JJ59_THEKT|nr:Kinesin-1 heavy chain [Thelohanellus kitauei]
MERIKLQSNISILQAELIEYKTKVEISSYDFINKESALINLIENSKDLKNSLDSQLNELRESHKKQIEQYHERISLLEKSIYEKELTISEHSANVSRLEKEKLNLDKEIDRLNQALMKISKDETIKQQAEEKLVNLKEAVDKELKLLTDLRSQFFEGIRYEGKKIPARIISCMEANEFQPSFDSNLGDLLDKQEQLMKTNVKLSQEVSRLQEHYKNSQSRIKQLENILYESKIKTEQENLQLKNELDSLLKSQQKNLELKKKIPQIAKTVKPSDKFKHEKQSTLLSN